MSDLLFLFASFTIVAVSMLHPLQYDVFFSYASQDKTIARALVSVLRQVGVSVWFAETEIDDLGSISKGIDEGLSRAKAFIALYSFAYPSRRACQYELTYAFLTAQSKNELQERMIVVNPESTNDHINPVELRDQRFFAINGKELDNPQLQKAALNVREHVKPLQYPLGSIHGSRRGPAWHGMSTARPTRFVGRLPELWLVHSLLHSSELPLLTGEVGPGITQICGFGGTGKSLLAEEYARRFGYAYPGGIFWLNAFGSDITRSAFPNRDKEQERQFRAIASSVNIPERFLNTSEVVGALAQHISQANQECLWVVDDLPSGLNTDSVRAWFAPHPLAKTLVTTRGREYSSFIRSLSLEGLLPEEGFDLLTRSRMLVDTKELAAARRVVSVLGFHPLALEVAGAALEAAEGLASFASFETFLFQSAGDPLSWAAELSDQLPTGHTPSIARTVLSSIQLVTDDAADFLRMASFLASAPIEPRLVADVFRSVYACDEGTAKRRAAAALKKCDSLSLSNPTVGGNRTVHALISRIVTSEEVDAERITELKRAAADSLLISVAEVIEGREFTHSPVCIAHARALLTQQSGPTILALMGRVGQFDSQTAHYDSAKEIYKRAVHIARQVGDDLILLGTLTNLLETLSHQASPDAPAIRQEAVTVALKIVSEAHDDQGLFIIAKLVRWLNEQEDVANARTVVEKALALPASVLPAHDSVRFDFLASLGRSLAIEGRDAEAVSLFEALNKLSAEVFGASSRASFLYRFQLLRVKLTNPASPEEGEAALTAVQVLLSDCRAHLDPRDNLIGWTLELLGVVYRSRGHFEESRKAFEENLDIYRQVLGDDHPVSLGILLQLSISERSLGNLDRARTLQMNVIEKLLNRSDSSPLDRLGAQAELVSTLRKLKRLDLAETAALEVLDSRLRLLGKNDPTTLSAWDVVIAILIDREDFLRAEPMLREAISARTGLFARSDLETVNLLAKLAEVLGKLNRVDEALALYTEVIDLTEKKSKMDPSELRPSELRLLRAEEGVFPTDKSNPENGEPLGGVVKEVSQHTPDHFLPLRVHREKVLKEAIESKGPEAPETIAAMTDLAETLAVMKQFRKARKLFESITDATIKRYGPQDDRSLKVWRHLVTILKHEGGDLNHLIKVEGVLLEMLRKRGVWDRPAVDALRTFAETVRSAGDTETFTGMGNLRWAAELGQEALSLSTTLFGERDPDSLLAANNLGGTYIRLGNYLEASKVLTPAFAIQIEIFGNDQALTQIMGRHLDYAFAMLGEGDKLKQFRLLRMNSGLATSGIAHPPTAEAVYHYYSILATFRDKEAAAKILFDHCQPLLSLEDVTLGETQLKLKKLTKKLLSPRKWFWSR